MRENRATEGKFPAVEALLSWHRIYAGFFRRFRQSWLPCCLLALLAFLPLAGLTLLSPEQKGGLEWQEFVLMGALLCRFLSPLAACLTVTYLARQDGRLDVGTSLWRSAGAHFLRAVGLVLAVWAFAALASLFLLLPGMAFLLGSSIALAVLVVEDVSVPEAVRRSWERTRDVRGALLMFWLVFLAGCLGLTAVVALVFTSGQLDELTTRPLAESRALLPLVLTWSFLYGASTCASYEIYRQIERLDLEYPGDLAPEQGAPAQEPPVA